MRASDSWPNVFWGKGALARADDARLIRWWQQVSPAGARTHLLDRSSGHEIAVHSYLPPASESAVYSDCTE